MIKTLKTERLILKPICIEDAKTRYIYGSNIDHVKYMMYYPYTSFEECLEDTKMLFVSSILKHPKVIGYSINYNGKMIGEISLYLDEEIDTWEVGWIIDPEHTGMGFATEAAEELFSYAKQDFNAMKIIAHCDMRNVASRKVMEKLGMILVEEHIKRVYLKRPEIAEECKYLLNL